MDSDQKTAIRRSILKSSAIELTTDQHQTLFTQKINESSEAISKGDYTQAVQLYTEAIALDPTNHILYSNRSAAYVKLEKFDTAVEDARQSATLNPAWAKAYLREGVALQCLGQSGEALAAFARGLAQEPSNDALLAAIVDSTLKSPLRGKMEPIFQQLTKMNLDKSAFVTVAVIGQELVASAHFSAAITVLECALKISSPSQRLRGSVLSALSSCHWSMGNLDRSVHYMLEDLQVCKDLADQTGECRVRGNLGAAYFANGNYTDALSNHRMQLVLAMKFKDRTTAASALSSLGHVYTAISDYPNALASHKQCVILMKQSRNQLSEARQIGNVGAVYLAVGDFSSAVECHTEHLRLAKALRNKTEQARALSNLGSAYHYMRTFSTAVSYHNQVLQIAQELGDRSLETRAYAGLGHATRSMGKYVAAKHHHELQLDSALKSRDKAAEGRACSNLGIIFHHLKEYAAAIKLHTVHYDIAKSVGDKASQGRTLGNLGNAYSAIGDHKKAIELHEEELTIANEVNDRHSKGSTHGNLAVSYQALNIMDSALEHYDAHLSIAQELKDSSSEARALYNIGNFHSVNGNFQRALPYYEQYLAVSQEIQDIEGESKACFNLGYAHYALGNYLESIRYYNQDLTISRETNSQNNMARAFCNLGLSQKSLGNLEEAMNCQTKFYNISLSTNNTQGMFRSLGNIADVMMLKSQQDDALKTYNKQLSVAKQSRDNTLIVKGYSALGHVYKSIQEFDKALGYFTQELNTAQESGDTKSESHAHGCIGGVHVALGNYTNAHKAYREQLECAQKLKNWRGEATAYANLGLTKLNMCHYEDAIVYFEQQLSTIETDYAGQDKDYEQVYRNLGVCYDALSDYPEAVKCYKSYLSVSQRSGESRQQYHAYRSLGSVYRSMGDLQQALVCYEKRLVIAHELGDAAAKASAYGELGCVHSLMANYEQAVSCLEQELRIAEEIEDKVCEGEAACGLGGVYQQMRQHDSALKYHHIDLDIAQSTSNEQCKCRSYGNLGLCHESMDQYDQAIHYQQLHLTHAQQLDDKTAMTLAYTSLGRVHHAIAHYQQSIQYLRQALLLAEELGNQDDEAKVRHRLGLALWEVGEWHQCQEQLLRATELLEQMRHDPHSSCAHKMSLFDLQTASFHALQRVMVQQHYQADALLMSERCFMRAFLDLLNKQNGSTQNSSLSQCNLSQKDHHAHSLSSVTLARVLHGVSQQRAAVLYYSAVFGSLFAWLITPNKGILKFHQMNLADLECSSDTEDNQSNNMTQKKHSQKPSQKRSMSQPHQVMSETESEADDLRQTQLEELTEKLNTSSDPSGFLQMVNHTLHTRGPSLNSCFNLSSGLNGLFSSTPDIAESPQHDRSATLASLYELLLQPFEEGLAEMELGPGTSDLILVLSGDLLLVPFALLKSSESQPSLCERFNLTLSPSLTALQSYTSTVDYESGSSSAGSLVVGNPSISSDIREHWQLQSVSGSEYESRIVAELLSTQALIGHEATKSTVLRAIEEVEVVHFACNISWKLSALFLTPESDSMSSRDDSFLFNSLTDNRNNDTRTPTIEYLLSAADVLQLKLNAKLVVLSSGYTNIQSGQIDTDGLVRLTHAFLAAGAECVMYCLWPVADHPSKLLMRSLYTSLQNGVAISRALSQAMKTVSSMKQYSHPRNWGGWVLVGRNVRISSKMAKMGQAISELVQQPENCRYTLKVILHLIEKAQQRIHNGTNNLMYVTFESVAAKVTHTSGWCELLESVGFRTEPSSPTAPCSIFFPHTDPADRLSHAASSLHALLGLSQNSLSALAKFTNVYEAGDCIIALVRDVVGRHKDASLEVCVSVRLWRLPGVHEFLASLGFDLLTVGESEVTLRMSRLLNKRYLQAALHSLLVIFETQEVPCVAGSSSSIESLSSTHTSSTSTSAFSKGSSPPMSPSSHKKSLFNPAEMERVRISKPMTQGAPAGREVSYPKHKPLSPDPSLCLSHQTDIRSRYPPHHQHHRSSGDSFDSGNTHLIEYCLDDRGSYNSSPHSAINDSSGQPATGRGDSDAQSKRQKPVKSSSVASSDGRVSPHPRSRCSSTSSQNSNSSGHKPRGDRRATNAYQNIENIPVESDSLRRRNTDDDLRPSSSEKLQTPSDSCGSRSKFNNRLTERNIAVGFSRSNGHRSSSGSEKDDSSDRLNPRTTLGSCRDRRKANTSNRFQMRNTRDCASVTTDCGKRNNVPLVSKPKSGIKQYSCDRFKEISRGISPTFSVKTSPLMPPRNGGHDLHKHALQGHLKRPDNVLLLSQRNDKLNDSRISNGSDGKSSTSLSGMSPSVPQRPPRNDRGRNQFPENVISLSRSGSSSSNHSGKVSHSAAQKPRITESHRNVDATSVPQRTPTSNVHINTPLQHSDSSQSTETTQSSGLHKPHNTKRVSFTELESDTSLESLHNLSTTDQSDRYKRDLMTYSDPSFVIDNQHASINLRNLTSHSAQNKLPSGVVFQSSKC